DRVSDHLFRQLGRQPVERAHQPLDALDELAPLCETRRDYLRALCDQAFEGRQVARQKHGEKVLRPVSAEYLLQEVEARGIACDNGYTEREAIRRLALRLPDPAADLPPERRVEADGNRRLRREL